MQITTKPVIIIRSAPAPPVLEVAYQIIRCTCQARHRDFSPISNRTANFVVGAETHCGGTLMTNASLRRFGTGEITPKKMAHFSRW